MRRGVFRLVVGPALGVATLAACGGTTYGGPDGNAGLTVPTPIAEGKPKGSEPVIPVPGKSQHPGRPVSSRPNVPAAPTPPKHGTLPDPPPLRLASQWQYALSYDAGKVRVKSARAHQLPKPLTTARSMGRFAIELWIGQELIDWVRFDFPLLGDSALPGSHVNLQLGAHSQVTVLVPASPRALRAVLVDRSTGEETALPWPPDIMPAGSKVP